MAVPKKCLKRTKFGMDALTLYFSAEYNDYEKQDKKNKIRNGTMKVIKRDSYVNKLIARRENGAIKVITGIRRSGKSFLLFNLYYDYLISQGVEEDQIIRIPLDDDDYEELRDRKNLRNYIRERIPEGRICYLMLDEIQLVDGFEGVLNGLARDRNLDIYVTGSNSKFLSTDIITEFRGRGDEVRIYPLTFSEYLDAYDGDEISAWNEYVTYGGLPMVATLKTDEQKANYLKTLFEKVYISDVVERNHINDADVLDKLIAILASAVGSLTNPLRLANTFNSNGYGRVTDKTIHSYLKYLQDAFLVVKANRYDVKGKKYISTPSKYYFTDIGLRNVYLNFRQQEENHLMENIIFNELLVRGYNVDVGVVEYSVTENGKQEKKKAEVDFVCNRGSERYYIQSAFAIPDSDKMNQEQASLVHIGDNFRKIIVVKDDIKLWRNEEGVTIMGIKEFLTDKDSLKL